ncbi:hypothetical protein [Chryseobacterium sp. CCH4-E10]|uniref:hypothetical protein n=1 Tax=Chryseobacterium sp. CCH4-E10 TaxID=1768758 RepID=UPI00082E731B|nr:hypothetical protein [Chryseobacterium sp. CCH4-E10]
MNKEIFIKRKQNLINLIADTLTKMEICEQDKISLNKVLEVLNEYSFENRLQKKGLLSHTIIDSLELDYPQGEKFITFDNEIR